MRIQPLFRIFVAVVGLAALFWMLRLEAPPAAPPEHLTDSADSAPTPIPVTLALPPPRPAPPTDTAASTATADSGGSKGVLRIDAAHADPANTLPWLIARGGRILLVREERIVAEMDGGFHLRPAEPVPADATLRLITGEVRRATGRPLPSNAEYALLVWPMELWNELTRALEHSPDSRHDLVYTLREGVMEVRDRRDPQTPIVRLH